MDSLLCKTKKSFEIVFAGGTIAFKRSGYSQQNAAFGSNEKKDIGNFMGKNEIIAIISSQY